MTESHANESSPSVVDDFFSALFANSNSTNEPSNISKSCDDGNADGNRDATVTPIPTTSTDIEVKVEAVDTEQGPTVENDHHQPQGKKQANVQQAQPPVLDEFDEYSLLSSKRKSDSTLNANNRARLNTEQPAQTLAKRQIDWSKVIPESRMLIHQLPKSTSKQELMDYFSKYGEVLEVVQKSSFGFVHFENPEQCARAVEAENFKTFKNVLLNLEICKRKPKFARLSENEGRQRNQGPRNNKHDNNASHGRSLSPPPREATKRRNSECRNGREPKVMNAHRNRQHEQNDGSAITDSNRHINDLDYDRTNNYRPNYSRSNNEPSTTIPNNDHRGRDNNYRPNYARHNSSAAAGYNYSNNNSPLIITRNGNEAPAVQIVSWNNDHGLRNYVESLLTQANIQTNAAIFNYSNYSRDELVKQMVLEGVKAIILIDSKNSSQGKVYLQVFAPVDHGDGVRYDEYDSVTPQEAVSIIQNTHPELRQPQQRYKQKRPQYNATFGAAQTRRNSYNYSSGSQYSSPTHGHRPEAQFDNNNYQQKPYYNPARGVQYQHPPQQPNYVTQSSYDQNTSLSSSPTIDPHTLATIYNLIQSDTLSRTKPPAVSLPTPSTTSTPTISTQPSIPQLLATLASTLGATGTFNSTPAAVATPNPAPKVTQQQPSIQQQPSMAALLSTAAGGNSALAQLLMQMTSSNSSSSNTNGNNSQSLVSGTSQPQRDYGYSSYGHHRN
ncbi:hypothetical protein [Parasitella parasitica]|uniref:RRM domain-containing protein n=1 Tax=Parasitella parasitica TaxID=35722 RepID=A0A0B7NU63_9FUNG|nr:hypothetical protein [Parasitella parasitica]